MIDKNKLLIITEAVDPEDSALGFFCEWLSAFAIDPHVQSVDVWCLREGAWDSKPANVSVRVFPNGLARRFLRFYSLLFSNHFNAVFVHMAPIWMVLGGLWWRMTHQRSLLWYTHGANTRMLSLAVRFANVICTATAQAFPIQNNKVHALGHGIGADFRSVVRSTGNNPNEAPHFISIGRISSRKAVLETIEFFLKIRELCPLARCTWIGEPLTEADRTYFETVQEDLRVVGISESVRFCGRVSYCDLPKMYANADCLLHFSKTGSLDKVVPEALSAGCSVFSTNPATKEVLPYAYWGGSMGTDAVKEALHRSKIGVSEEQRIEASNEFLLATLIHRIVVLAFSDVS